MVCLSVACLADRRSLSVFAEDDGEAAMAMKRLSGSELARAVLKQQEAQRRAALALQAAWKKRKVGVDVGANNKRFPRAELGVRLLAKPG